MASEHFDRFISLRIPQIPHPLLALPDTGYIAQQHKLVNRFVTVLLTGANIANAEADEAKSPGHC